MVKGNGRGRHHAGVAAVIDGPQPGRAEIEAVMAAMTKEHGPAIAEQNARADVRIEALGPTGCVKFTLVNKHVAEIHPTAIYVSFSSLLNLCGQYLIAANPQPGDSLGGVGA